MNKKNRTYLLLAAVWVAGGALANPNTVNVEMKFSMNQPAPQNTQRGQHMADTLSTYNNGKEIDIIEFPEDKKFIRFTFPDGFSDFDLKVFEKNEVGRKKLIMKMYQANREKGVKAFDELWRGHASSEQNAREFQVHRVGRNELVVRNKNVDGTPQGVLHDYILRFTVEGVTYLKDPSIRNTRTN